MFKCDVYTQLLVDQTQKDFEYFICFLKCFYTFVCLEFLFKMPISCFYQKNSFRSNFPSSSRVSSSYENEDGKIKFKKKKTLSKTYKILKNLFRFDHKAIENTHHI